MSTIIRADATAHVHTSEGVRRIVAYAIYTNHPMNTPPYRVQAININGYIVEPCIAPDCPAGVLEVYDNSVKDG